MADVTSICNQALAAVGTRSTISSIAEASNEARACLTQYEPTKRHLLRSAHWGFARDYMILPLMKAHRSTPAYSQPPTEVLKPGWDPRFEPPPPWLYAYRLDSAMLAIRYIVPQSPDSFSGASSNGVPMFGTASSVFDASLFLGPAVKFELANIDDFLVFPAGQKLPFNALLTNMPRAIACYTKDVTDPNFFDESFLRAFVQGLATNICFTLTGDLKLFDALAKMTNGLIMEARVKSANEGLSSIDIMPDWFRVRGAGPSIGTGPWIAEYGPLFGGVS